MLWIISKVNKTDKTNFDYSYSSLIYSDYIDAANLLKFAVSFGRLSEISVYKTFVNRSIHKNKLKNEASRILKKKPGFYKIIQSFQLEIYMSFTI